MRPFYFFLLMKFELMHGGLYIDLPVQQRVRAICLCCVETVGLVMLQKIFWETGSTFLSSRVSAALKLLLQCVRYFLWCIQFLQLY